MPLGPVRGAGGPEGCYFIERAVDVMAKKIGLDPIEFRRRNVSQRNGSAGGGEVDFELLLDTLVKSSHYEELLQWRSDMLSKFRQQGPSQSSLIGGLGVSMTGSNESEEDDEEDWIGESSGGEGGADGGSKPWQSGGSSSSSAGEKWTG